jgi:hypothetical protein
VLARVAAAATALSASPAAAAKYVGSAVLVSDDVQGIVSVTQRAQRRRVRVSVSLHGVKPKTGYRVVAATRQCSAAKPGRSVFELTFGVEAAQDVFVTEIVNRTGSLDQVQCVRLHQLGAGGKVTQVSVGGFGGGVDDDR